MGDSRFDQGKYKDQAKDRAKSNTPTFANTATAQATGVYNLDPRLNAAKKKRVSRDTAARGERIPVGVFFDETGSMAKTPVQFQAALPQIMPLFNLKGYGNIDLLPGCFGNANSDKLPFQIGSFNNGNEIDEEVRAMVLEGNGGDGDWRENPEMVLAFMAYRTMHDHMDKRGERGILFLATDEGIRDLDHNMYNEYFEPEEPLNADIPYQKVLEDCRKLYDVYYILPDDTSGAQHPDVNKQYRQLFDEAHFIRVANMDDIASVIVAIVGLAAADKEWSEIKQDLIGAGMSAVTVNDTEKAVAVVSGPSSKGAITTGLPKSTRSVSTIKRLS